MTNPFGVYAMSRTKRKQPKWFDEYVPEEVANSTIFKFAITVDNGGGKKTIDVDLKADLDIDYGIIVQQLEDAPAEFAYWAAIYSELKLQSSVLERQIRARRGKLTETAINQAKEASVRLTDKQVQAIVDADKDLEKLELRHMITQKHTGKMYFMIEALKMKCDNLRSLAGFARLEMSQSQ